MTKKKNLRRFALHKHEDFFGIFTIVRRKY